MGFLNPVCHMLMKAFSAFVGKNRKRAKSELTLPNLGPANALVVREGARWPRRIEIRRGVGNSISIGARSKVVGSIIVSGDGNTISIGEDCDWKGHILVKGSGQTIRIGDHTSAADVYVLAQEGCDVTIGASCMLSRKIEIRTTDAHSLLDRATGARLNHPASVSIGDHVWIGVGCVINKGSSLPSDTVVGAMSFVNQRFSEEGTVIAGVPARVLRTGVTWRRERRKSFPTDILDDWR